MVADGNIGIEEGMKSNRKGKLQVKIISNNSNNHFWIKMYTVLKYMTTQAQMLGEM